MLTKSTITIEIEVPISGNWCPAEPDIGLIEGYFEDAQIDWPISTPKEWLTEMSTEYADQIQEALTETMADDRDRADDRRDEAADARAEMLYWPSESERKTPYNREEK